MKSHTRQNVKDLAGLSLLIALVAIVIYAITTMGSYNLWTSTWDHIGNLFA